MADKHLDTALVNAGRSKKYTQGSGQQRDSAGFIAGVFETVEAKHATRNRAKASCLRPSRDIDPLFATGSHVRMEGGAGCALFPPIPFWPSLNRATMS